MEALTLWLQHNPAAILIMFVVVVLGLVMTIILGWRSFYDDYLSREVTIPVWLLILVLFIGCLFAVERAGVTSGGTVVKEPKVIEGKRLDVQKSVVDGKGVEKYQFD